MKFLTDWIEESSNTHQTFWTFPAENKQLSLWHLITVSKYYAENLVALGVNKQDLVGLVMTNSSDYVALLLAIWRINAIAVPLRPQGSINIQNDQHLQNRQFSLIIYDELINKKTTNKRRSEPTKHTISLENFLKQESPHISIPHSQITTDDVAMLQFSSGNARSIVSHEMMMTQLENITENHTTRQGIAPISMASWVPIHRNLGLFVGVLTPLFNNCSNILAPPSYYLSNPARWFALLATHQVDFTFSTNSTIKTTCNMLNKLQKHKGIDLSRLHIYLATENNSSTSVRKNGEIFSPLGLLLQQIYPGEISPN
jgi:acyl-CoA synthetase (AMP-forming)/AMP-acid ligase II